MWRNTGFSNGPRPFSFCLLSFGGSLVRNGEKGSAEDVPQATVNACSAIGERGDWFLLLGDTVLHFRCLPGCA